MSYQQISVINNFPLIQQLSSNKVLANEIVQILEQAIYLPHDYIVHRVSQPNSF
jgi:hypothetical protein